MIWGTLSETVFKWLYICREIINSWNDNFMWCSHNYPGPISPTEALWWESVLISVWTPQHNSVQPIFISFCTSLVLRQREHTMISTQRDLNKMQAIPDNPSSWMWFTDLNPLSGLSGKRLHNRLFLRSNHFILPFSFVTVKWHCKKVMLFW